MMTMIYEEILFLLSKEVKVVGPWSQEAQNNRSDNYFLSECW